MNNEFPVSGLDEKVTTAMIFGVETYDRKDANELMDFKRNKNEEVGSADRPEVVYNSAFDFSKPETQQFMYQMCDKLDAAPFVVTDRDPQCREEAYESPDSCPDLKTTCIMRELELWL